MKRKVLVIISVFLIIIIIYFIYNNVIKIKFNDSIYLKSQNFNDLDKRMFGPDEYNNFVSTCIKNTGNKPIIIKLSSTGIKSSIPTNANLCERKYIISQFYSPSESVYYGIFDLK